MNNGKCTLDHTCQPAIGKTNRCFRILQRRIKGDKRNQRRAIRDWLACGRGTNRNVDRILRASWPGWDLERRPAAGPPPLRHLRLCGALALARVHDGVPAHPVHLEAMLDEDLGDELTRRAASLGRDLSLPALLLVTPAAGAARTADPDPVRALAILTHATGRTCNPGGAPLLSEALQAGHAIDLWTPEPAHA